MKLEVMLRSLSGLSVCGERGDCPRSKPQHEPLLCDSYSAEA